MMSRIVSTVAIAVLCVGIGEPTGLEAQDAPSHAMELSVPDIARRAHEWNLSVRRAAQAVGTAEESLRGTPGWDASSLSLSGGVRSEPADPWRFGTSVRSQPFSQLALQAGVDTDVTEAGEFRSQEYASVEVSPLAPPRTTWPEERDYQVAVIRFNDARRDVARSAEAAALHILVRRRETLLAEQTLELREREYQIESRRQELGEASFQDVQDRQMALIEARQQSFAAQQRELQSESDLARIIALAESPVRVAPLTREDLRTLVDRRLTRVDGHRQSPAATAELLTAEAELTAQEYQLDATVPWRPELTLSAGISFPHDAGRPTTTGGVELRLSPGQDRRFLQQRRQEELELQRLEVSSRRSTAELDRQLTLQSLTLEQEALDAAELQLQRDRTAEEEAVLLLQRGERTELQLEQLRLNRSRSEIGVFQAAVDLYATAGNYLDLVDVSGTE